MTGRKILLVVDVQRDFIDGSLAVPGAEAIIPGDKRDQDGADLLYFTLDWHAKKSLFVQGKRWSMARALRSLHFRGKSRRRAAGRAGGSEDKIHPERAEQGEGGYGALAAVTASNQSLFLAGDEVTVCGIASEFCVLETLKNVFRLSQEVGFDVNVFLKGTVGFDSTPLLEWILGNGVKEY